MILSEIKNVVADYRHIKTIEKELRSRALIHHVPLTSDVFGQSLYDYLYPQRILYCNNTKTKFVSFSVGYVYCGSAKTCSCCNQQVSKAVANAKSRYTSEEKTRMLSKRENTNTERYGVKSVFQDAIIKEKIVATNLERYGAENPQQNKVIRKKTRGTNLEKYGVENPTYNHLTGDQIDKINDIEWLYEQNKKQTLSSLAKDLGVSSTCLYKKFSDNELKLAKHPNSDFEEEVFLFLAESGIDNIVRNDRAVLNGKELDLYLPDFNFAIECNGSYWHSELNGKDKSYHLSKSNICKEKNIHLIHLWHHTWVNNNTLAKSRIKAKIGMNNRIYARKCKMNIVGTETAKEFLNNNHLQGHCTASDRFGLFYERELVALMTFGKSRFDKNIQWELLRYCSKLNYNIIGGASRLFKTFMHTYDCPSVISYSDRSWNSGNLYNRLGFEYRHSTAPAYYYTQNYQKFENRVAYQKHKLKDKLDTFDPTKTEWENMQDNKFDRIWDCGTDVWVCLPKKH